MPDPAFFDLLAQWHHFHPIVMPVGEALVGFVGLKYFIWPISKVLTEVTTKAFGLNKPQQLPDRTRVERAQPNRTQARETNEPPAARELPRPALVKKEKKPKPAVNLDDVQVLEPKTAEDMYVTWCMQRLKDDVRQEAEVIGTKITELRVAESDLLDLAQQHADVKHVLEVARVYREQQVASASEAFEQWAKRAEVARIEVTEYGWCIVTTPLNMNQDGNERSLGKVEIHLDHAGRLRVYNQTKRIEQDGHFYDHPMICDGIPCLPGVITAAVTEAAIEQDLGSVLDVLVPFLTQVTQQSFVAITEWPEVQNHVRLARQI